MLALRLRLRISWNSCMANQVFSRSLTSRDTLALAFGAMIGWGWIVLAGPWLLEGGTGGAIIAFAAVGAAILIISLLYGELASAMPKVGGEHVYSLRALGRFGSFICTWSIAMVYVAVAAFESVALGTAVEYLVPRKLVYLWQIAGYDVYLSWVLIGVVASIVVTIINVRGIKLSAIFQTTLTAALVIAGIMLITGGLFKGDAANVEPLFTKGPAGVLAVMAMSVFVFTGFDVIPQAAEEIDVDPRSLGQLLVIAVVSGTIWYILILLAVSALMGPSGLSAASLSAADASGVAWGSAGTKLLILGGIAGIITSWNGFLVGGSRAIYALAESHMLPRYFAVLHPRFHTPHRAIIVIGVLSALAPLFGRQILGWLANSAGFAAVVAYFLVAVSFIVLRKREPDMPRPFKLPAGLVLGALGVVVTLLLGYAYLPGSPGALAWPQEWLMLLLWFGVGLPMYAYASSRRDLSVASSGTATRIAPKG